MLMLYQAVHKGGNCAASGRPCSSNGRSRLGAQVLHARESAASAFAPTRPLDVAASCMPARRVAHDATRGQGRRHPRSHCTAGCPSNGLCRVNAWQVLTSCARCSLASVDEISSVDRRTAPVDATACETARQVLGQLNAMSTTGELLQEIFVDPLDVHEVWRLQRALWLRTWDSVHAPGGCHGVLPLCTRVCLTI